MVPRHAYPWRRWLAASIFIVLIGGPLGVLLISSMNHFYNTLIDINAMNAAAAEYRRSIARAPYLVRKARVINEQLTASKTFYGETSTESASAAFGQAVKEVIETSGGEVRSVTINPTVRDTGLERLNLGVDVILPEDRLAELLSALRDQHPLLFIDALSINGEESAATTGRLWLVMNVSAFRRE